ncbi:uncharacterized protein [Littorina saxatilis]|uniref:uncharacterized protein n=1 Tax=Littorina saxatilis TaxID=31220 RepID=UPI0038B4F267
MKESWQSNCNATIAAAKLKDWERFLAEERLSYRDTIGSALSASHKLDMGVPQGSIIAPILFSIMLHDIDKVDVGGASVLLYADDLALLDNKKPMAKGTYVKNHIDMAEYQQKVDQLSRYMHDNGFTLAPEKTVFFVASRQKFIIDKCSIQVNGKQIKPSPHALLYGSSNRTDMIHDINIISHQMIVSGTQLDLQ